MTEYALSQLPALAKLANQGEIKAFKNNNTVLASKTQKSPKTADSAKL